MNTEKVCPFCAETIKAAAVVCRYCGRDLPDASNDAPPKVDEELPYGITVKEGRYFWVDCYFRDLDQAIAYAQRNQGLQPASGSGGSSVSAVQPQPINWWFWIPIGLVGAFFLFVITHPRTPADDAKSQQRLAIELCWKDQGKKSHEPSQARFIATVCEKMESDFKKQYGVDP